MMKRNQVREHVYFKPSEHKNKPTSHYLNIVWQIFTPNFHFQEQAEQGQNVEQAVTPQVVMVTNKAPLESTNEEPEPAQDIEIPPPMEIQDHTFKAAQEPPMEEVSTKLVGVETAASWYLTHKWYCDVNSRHPRKWFKLCQNFKCHPLTLLL